MAGPVTDKVKLEVAQRILSRLNLISRSQQVQSLTLAVIQDSVDSRLFFQLDQSQQNELLDTLYDYSSSSCDSSLGKKSNDLYAKIIKDIG